MLREAVRRQRAGEDFSGLVFDHPDHISIGDCISGLELIAKLGERSELVNQIIYLPL
jgi:hypothetical protein